MLGGEPDLFGLPDFSFFKQVFDGAIAAGAMTGRLSTGPFHPFPGVLAAQADHPLDHAEGQGGLFAPGPFWQSPAPMAPAARPWP